MCERWGWVLKGGFYKVDQNQVCIKLVNRFFYKLLGIRFSLYPSGNLLSCITLLKTSQLYSLLEIRIVSLHDTTDLSFLGPQDFDYVHIQPVFQLVIQGEGVCQWVIEFRSYAGEGFVEFLRFCVLFVFINVCGVCMV